MRIAGISALFLVLINGVAGANLYLLGGTPDRLSDEGFASVLYSVRDGVLTPIRTIHSAEEPSRYIRIHHEARRIVISQNSAGGAPRKFWFLDMDNPQTIHEWNASTDPLVEKKPTMTWAGFLALPGRIAFAVTVYDDQGSRLLGVREDAAGAYTFESLPLAYLKYAQPAGWSGYGDMDGVGLPFAFARDEVFGGIPERLLRGSKSGALQVRNSFVSVVRLVVANRSGDGAQGYAESMLLRNEKSGEWRGWSVPGNSRTGAYATAFGPWVVATETADQVPGVTLPPGRGQDTQVTTGPRLRYRRQYLQTRPGRTHLLHVPSGRTLLLEPGDADSEVLLVDGKTVYFRANDEIYSAPLTEKGIGSKMRLAKGEAVLDIHWAFVSEAAW